MLSRIGPSNPHAHSASDCAPTRSGLDAVHLEVKSSAIVRLHGVPYQDALDNDRNGVRSLSIGLFMPTDQCWRGRDLRRHGPQEPTGEEKSDACGHRDQSPAATARPERQPGGYPRHDNHSRPGGSAQSRLRPIPTEGDTGDESDGRRQRREGHSYPECKRQAAATIGPAQSISEDLLGRVSKCAALPRVWAQLLRHPVTDGLFA